MWVPKEEAAAAFGKEGDDAVRGALGRVSG
jgi:hypothetical protein